MIVPTDANGLASAVLLCGSRAGAGINRVTASSVGVLSSVSFLATGTSRPAGNLYVHLGNNQTAEPGVPLPQPLSVHVSPAPSTTGSPAAIDGSSSMASSTARQKSQTAMIARRWSAGRTRNE